MGRFFNERLKNMRYVPGKLEQARQNFRKEQTSSVAVLPEAITVLPVVDVSETKITPVQMTIKEKRIAALAKARAAKKAKNVSA